MDKSRPPRRAGFSPRGVPAAVCAVLFSVLVGWFLLPQQGEVPHDERPLTWQVKRAVFVHEIFGKGAVESAENVEVKCEVKAMGFRAAEILELPIAEGTFVQQGDVLARLDTSSLEKLKTQQQILLNARQALLTQAEADLEVALATQSEYINGLFPDQQRKLRIAVAASREALRKAQRLRDYGKSMYRQGFATQLALEAHEFSVEKAQIDLDKDENALMVAEVFKMPKTLKQHDATIANLRASLRSRRGVVKLNQTQLADIDEQIAKCVITAPSAGQLSYVHLHHYDHSHMVEEGASVRQDQTMFALPNSNQMQVVVTIREDYIRVLQPGMTARLSLDGMPGVVLCGRVEEIAKMPKPDTWYGPAAKEYETTISIDSSSIEGDSNRLRPGLTAEVTIQIENDRTKKELLLPEQATFRHGEKSYCILVDGQQWRPVEVEIGRSNGVFVVIDRSEAPLEGRHVIQGVANFRDQVGMPEMEDEPEAESEEEVEAEQEDSPTSL